jgi:endogenous inhibitor of DNA gyrase (YacG/DUF329 family)
MVSKPEALSASLPEGARRVICPACQGESIYHPSNLFRPFCSDRCKNNDFGAWASETFRMPTEAPPDEAPFGDPRLQ